jgi:hypothetical protein
MNTVRVLPVEVVRAAHHAIPVELHPASTDSLWPAIITAAATVLLAALAYIQIRAGRAQTREFREAAERQWQPRVFVHGWHGPKRGDGDLAAPDEMAVPYYLSNEGVGPAFNVEHGITVNGTAHTWNDWQWPNMRAGDFIPALNVGATQPVPSSAIVVAVKMSEWGDGQDLVYWARFENLLGERFEVRNHQDPTAPAEFRHVS